jgi:hypothetical protein
LPVIGREKTEELIRCIRELGRFRDMRELRPNFVPIEQDSTSSE